MSDKDSSEDKRSCFGEWIPINQSSDSGSSESEDEENGKYIYRRLVPLKVGN